MSAAALRGSRQFHGEPQAMRESARRRRAGLRQLRAFPGHDAHGWPVMPAGLPAHRYLARSQAPKLAPLLNRNDGLMTTRPEEAPLVVSMTSLVVHGPVMVPCVPV
jgi:hypothetical protein